MTSVIQKFVVLLFSHCVILTFPSTTFARDTSINTQTFLSTISKWARSSIILPNTKGWFFPPGSKVVLNPQLEVPVLNKEIFGVESVFRMAFPLTIEFDSISLKRRKWSLFPMDDFDTFNRHKRSYSLTTERTMLETNFTVPLCSSLALERIIIFRKMESFLDSFGWGSGIKEDGKSCLLRAICEIHEFHLPQQFGVLGEIVTLFVSVNRLSDGCEDKFVLLKEYIKAEKYGAEGQCEKYYRRCSKSFFLN